jgi:hypothetical protein
MRATPTNSLQGQLFGIAQRIGPVLGAVSATLLIIVGILIIIFPVLLRWIVGIGLVLAGVALLTSLLVLVAKTNAS